jgi:hypothetical protein
MYITTTAAFVCLLQTFAFLRLLLVNRLIINLKTLNIFTSLNK